jgi:hypothetical protein
VTVEPAVGAAGPSGRWSLAERAEDLRNAERHELDLLVVGGGITGAGVLRDAATRSLRALLVERGDFASGTSSRSSKLIHGGLRYIAEGQLAITREACRERDRLLQLNPHLVRPMPFLFPTYADSKVPLWQVRALMWTYAALANFRRSSRFRMLDADGVAERVPDLRTDGLRGAALYCDAHVDDARLVLETLKSARAMGAAAVNHSLQVLACMTRSRSERWRSAPMSSSTRQAPAWSGCAASIGRSRTPSFARRRAFISSSREVASARRRPSPTRPLTAAICS